MRLNRSCHIKVDELRALLFVLGRRHWPFALGALLFAETTPSQDLPRNVLGWTAMTTRGFKQIRDTGQRPFLLALSSQCQWIIRSGSRTAEVRVKDET